jgi:hypothetical protein
VPKSIFYNFQAYYEIPTETYTHVAFNRDGALVGFRHPPIRDYKNGWWVDPTDGSAGDLILYERWDTSIKETSTLTDMSQSKVKAKRARIKAQVNEKIDHICTFCQSKGVIVQGKLGTLCIRCGNIH